MQGERYTSQVIGEFDLFSFVYAVCLKCQPLFCNSKQNATFLLHLRSKYMFTKEIKSMPDYKIIKSSQIILLLHTSVSKSG